VSLLGASPALVGIIRRSPSETDRRWMAEITGGTKTPFEHLEIAQRGLIVAWQSRGTRPEFASRARSLAGTHHVIIAGRAHAPGNSPEEYAEALAQEGEAALLSTAGPCVVLAWSDQNTRQVFYRPEGGQRVLCYARLPDGLLFASDARVLALHPNVDTETDWLSASEQMVFGHVYAEKTMWGGIQRLGAGERLSVEDGEVAVIAAPQPQQPSSSDPESSIERIDLALQQAVRTAWEGPGRTALCLSAGLDSRTLMAVAHKQGISQICVTNGIEGSIELRLADRMCRTLNADYLTCLLEKQVVDQILLSASEVARITDGEGTIQGTNMLHLTKKYRSHLGFDRVIRGIGGELLKLSLAYGYACPEEIVKAGDDSAAASHIFTQLAYSPSKIEASTLRGDLSAFMDSGPKASFMNSWNALAVEQNNLGNKISTLFLRAYIARATVDSMRILRQSVDLEQPFLDERFLKTLFSTPTELRLNPSLQVELIRRNAPELLRIPKSSIRVPLDAGRWRTLSAELFERVAVRLGLREIDVPEKWLLGSLDNFFQETLLQEESLERPHIEPDAMRALLSRSDRDRAGSRTFLGRLCALELHLRNSFKHEGVPRE
jgi:asparagine synthase (glutamine-hydrolysing)